MANFPQSFEPVGSDSILEQFIQLKNYVKQFEQIISSNENVKTIPQSLTEQQKAQARENIGAGTGSGVQINVVDNLDSTSSVDALSAKQGKILNETLNSVRSSVSANLLQFQYELDENTGDISALQGDVSELNQESARALKTPMSAPSTTEIVGIDSSNSQVNISAGNGININNTIGVNESVFGVPSNNNFISISVTSGTEKQYTAPSNGYLTIGASPSSTGMARVTLLNSFNFGAYNSNNFKMGVGNTMYNSENSSIFATCPCKKGDNIRILTTNIDTIYCHFVPSEV